MNKMYFGMSGWWRWAAVVAISLTATLSWLAIGQSTPPDIKAVALSSEPLYAPARGDKPTMTLALSVEYPTVGAQYRNPATPRAGGDDSYSNATEYLGYWDANSCYAYYNANGTDTAADPKRFIRSGSAETKAPAQRTCTDAFSGNFLNWASSSAIDILRLAMTGGDRVLDTETKTVLQRAVLPDGSFNYQIDFSKGDQFFPRKYLAREGKSGKKYFGAVPESMVAYVDNSDAIVIKNTRNEIYFSRSWTPDDHNFTYYKYGDRFFYSRVEVCNQDASGKLVEERPWTMCSKQPAGNYKPTGVLQKYADQARVAVFGYLMDADQSSQFGRYGGVLRAPMKFTGYRTYDRLGTENTPTGGNPGAEWNLSTGVFNENPLSDPLFGVSGVVNYINRFGRNANYKDRDPMGELHLEALRYLQGQKDPTPEAISGLDGQSTNGRYAGFPAYTTWVDPYEGRDPASDFTCHRANILAIGDTITWDHGQIPAANAANDIPDIDFWRRTVQRFEKKESGTYPDAAGVTRTVRGRPSANAAFPDPDGVNKYQIYGSAYWARSHDIRDLAWTSQSDRTKRWLGLRVRTMIYDVNGEGLSDTGYDNNPLFMAAKYGGYQVDSFNANGGPYNTWGNPFLQSGAGGVGDLGATTGAMGPRADYIWASQDVGREGVADTYYRAGNGALATIQAFDEIFSRAVTSASSIAGGAIQSKNLTQAGNTIYRGNFDVSDWRGDLLAYPVTVDKDNVSTIGTEPTWSAAAQLNAMSEPVANRKIYTGNAGGNVNPVAVEFKWSEISGALQSALNKPSASSAADNLGQQRLNYIRGDSSNYGTFRRRYQLMGDVINSGVVYSGAPAPDVSSSSSYNTFYTANAGRTSMVAVGANDGMLHAFNASDGKELFAYIPSWVATNLSALTSLDYVNNHRSFVDGTPAVAEAELTSGWATVLVSGTGAGGKGVFALDVTDPSTFNASKVLWEFTNADDPDFDLGNVVGKPQIVKLRTSSYNASEATYKWFAVFGNGVNSYVADSSGRFSLTGKPALYFLDLSKPKGDAWKAGTNFFKVSFPTNATLNPATAAGIVNFTAVLDSAKVVSKIFVGDLQGNVWKLNFAVYGASDWSLDNLSAFKSSTKVGGSPLPLYVAQDAAGNIQPITAAPTVVVGDTKTSSYVMFGTGKYLESADNLSQSVQSEYMIYDDGTGQIDAAGGVSAITSRDYLQAAVVNSTTGSITVAAYTQGLAKTTTSTVKSGWYFDFPKLGERQVNSGSSQGSQVVFASLIPTLNAATANCGTPTAGGVQYVVDLVTGEGTFSASTVGILGELLLLEMPGATVYSAKDSTGRKKKTMLTKVIQQGSAGLSDSTLKDTKCPDGTPTGTICTRVIAGRLSWRQVDNYDVQRLAPW